MHELDMLALTNALQTLTPVLVVAAMMAWFQFRLCRSEQPVVIRLIPGMVLSLMMGICIRQIWLWNTNDHTLNFVISFMAGLYIGGLLLGCCAAWVGYLIGQYVKIRRKNFTCKEKILDTGM